MPDAGTPKKDLEDAKHDTVQDENIDELNDNKVRYPDPDDPTKTLTREPEDTEGSTVTFPEPTGTDGPRDDAAIHPVGGEH